MFLNWSHQLVNTEIQPKVVVTWPKVRRIDVSATWRVFDKLSHPLQNFAISFEAIRFLNWYMFSKRMNSFSSKIGLKLNWSSSFSDDVQAMASLCRLLILTTWSRNWKFFLLRVKISFDNSVDMIDFFFASKQSPILSQFIWNCRTLLPNSAGSFWWKLRI